MTALQAMRRQGFAAHLALRGIGVRLLPSGPDVTALVEEFISPAAGSVADSGAQVLDAEQRAACRLAILAEHLPGVAVPLGSTFRSDAIGKDFRVVRVEPLATAIANRFTCEIEDAG